MIDLVQNPNRTKFLRICYGLSSMLKIILRLLKKKQNIVRISKHRKYSSGNFSTKKNFKLSTKEKIENYENNNSPSRKK